MPDPRHFTDAARTGARLTPAQAARLKGKKKFSVLLLYPDFLASQYREDTYLAHVYADDPAGAIETAQKEVAVGSLDVGEDVTCFLPLVVFAGHLEDLKP